MKDYRIIINENNVACTCGWSMMVIIPRSPAHWTKIQCERAAWEQKTRVGETHCNEQHQEEVAS